MKKLVVTVSIRDAKKAAESINDNRELASQFEENGSTEWESIKHFDEWDDEDTEEMEQLSSDIEEQFQMAGVEEYEINEEEV